MKPSPAPSLNYLRAVFLVVPLLMLPAVTSAQQKKPATSSSSSSLNAPPKSAPAPPKPATPPPPKPKEPEEHHDDHHAGTSGGPGAHSGGTGASGLNSSNSSGNSGGHGSTAANKSTPGAPGTNKSTTGKSEPEPLHPSHDPIPADPRAPTGLNLRAASGSTGNYKATGTGTAHTNTSTGSTAGKSGASGSTGAGKPSATRGPNANNPGNPPGTTKLANGGTKTLHTDGSSVERSRNGKVTGVTTAKGTTAKFDLHGNATAIHDGKGMTISRGPHGERRIESTGADHSRLVSTGKHSGFLEHHISRGGHDFVQRSYVVNGQAYARVYAPYFYLGYPYFWYIPTINYAPSFYGWAYNPWLVPVPYVWGWYGSPWFAPYGYYFAPYPVYPAPAFWLVDYALAESLRLAAEEAQSGTLRQSGFVYASEHLSAQSQGNGSQFVTQTIKDQIVEQVKQIIADEKDAAARHGNSAASTFAAPAVPPSLDSRFTLFIVSSELSLETMGAACPLSSGDILQRKEYVPDANTTVTVEVASSKNGDCAIGTVSRLKVDDLEEMYDNFREKIDAGLKSLSENQGKNGIPSGPAANPQKVPEGHADPDPTVADALMKQQQAADATEKDVEAATEDDGSAD